MNNNHCGNLTKDRELGERWEKNFGQLVMRYGLTATAHQIGRKENAAAAWYLDENGKKQHVILPDVVIWSFPGQHHEIKHKNPSKKGWFGLEKYRFDSLRWFQNTTKQPVFYTIHNHDFSGGRSGLDNHLDHWVTASVTLLDQSWTHVADPDMPGPWNESYCNGIKIKTTIYYWKTSIFIPLRWILGGEFQDEIYRSHPAQIELEQVKKDKLKEQEKLAKMEREGNQLLAMCKSLRAVRRRCSADIYVEPEQLVLL